MILSNTIDGFLNANLMTEAEAIQFMAKAGFDAYDMPFGMLLKNPDHPFCQDNYREYALELRKVADEAGIFCNQAHAPQDNSFGKPETDVTYIPKLHRAIEIASILGAKIIIVHPIQCMPYADNAELLMDMNIKMYKSLIPLCEKYNIKVACENMWQWNRFTRQCIHSTCSRAEEFRDYIDAVDSPWIVACLDIGHVVLVSEDLPRMIRILGHRIQALHIHDNNYKDDLHSIPYLYDVNFDKMTKALKEVGYQGDFTYEIGGIYEKFPRSAWIHIARVLVECGRHMIEQIEG